MGFTVYIHKKSDPKRSRESASLSLETNLDYKSRKNNPERLFFSYKKLLQKLRLILVGVEVEVLFFCLLVIWWKDLCQCS